MCAHVCHAHACAPPYAPEEAFAGAIKGRPAGTTNFFFPSVMAGLMLHTGKGTQTLLCLVARPPPLIHICMCCETSQAAERLPRSGAMMQK